MLDNLDKLLNEDQRKAVETIDGPVLVIAGAGSGKTRVLIHRTAWLIHRHRVAPEEIVAVTFTNKAADEMKSRIADLCGEPRGIRMGTFHSLCLRILRVEAHRLGYDGRFVIFDTDDQVSVMKDVAEDLHIDTTRRSPRSLLHRISAVRNRTVSHEEVTAALSDAPGDLYLDVYEAYRRKLMANNAMDFDDLILNVLALFDKHPEVERRTQGRTRHVMVDEFQDTNRPQYALVRRLSEATRNLCVVGDDAQSIYRFRGAEVGNILRFTDDYPDAGTVKLTRNYRSSGRILQAADNLIRHNRSRIDKDLWTRNPEGVPITYLQTGDDRAEALFVVQQIASLRDAGDVSDLGDVAVLYRTNAQSRLIEEALIGASMPYRIYGGVRFYDRKEIRDLLAYLRVVSNPGDDVALRRVLNVPPRGLGKVTLSAMEESARAEGTSLYRALESMALESPPARATHALRTLAGLFTDLREAAGRGERTSALLAELIDRIEYEAYLTKADTGDAESRIENINQLIAAAQESESRDQADLAAFLDGVALLSDVESVTGTAGVNLMTLHCAKGLEFPVVFIVGMEENLFPHARSVMTADDEEIEEERRLCYVGMTRAESRLVLSCSRERRAFGSFVSNEPSRFIGEIGMDLINDLSPDWQPVRQHMPRWGRRGEPGLGDEDLSEHPDDDEPSSGLRVGMKVYHDQFGYGQVETLEGNGEKQKAVIRFSGMGRKKLMTHYARLERVR